MVLLLMLIQFTSTTYSLHNFPYHTIHNTPPPPNPTHTYTNTHSHTHTYTLTSYAPSHIPFVIYSDTDQAAKDFIHARLPIPLSETEEERTAAGAPSAIIYPYTRLRMLRPGMLSPFPILTISICGGNSFSHWFTL